MSHKARLRLAILFSLFVVGSAPVALYPWQALRRAWGEYSALAPTAASAALLAWLGVVAYRRLRKAPIKRLLLLAAVIGAALWVLFVYLADAEPVERIHLAEYGLVALLWARALESRLGALKAALAAAFIALAVGFVDELFQGLLPRRYFGWRDVALNGLSGCVGSIAWLSVAIGGKSEKNTS